MFLLCQHGFDLHLNELLVRCMRYFHPNDSVLRWSVVQRLPLVAQLSHNKPYSKSPTDTGHKTHPYVKSLHDSIGCYL